MCFFSGQDVNKSRPNAPKILPRFKLEIPGYSSANPATQVISLGEVSKNSVTIVWDDAIALRIDGL
jgi:hypothetical protein